MYLSVGRMRYRLCWMQRNRGDGMIKTGKIKKVKIFDNSQYRYSIEKVKEVTGCDFVMTGTVFDFGTLKHGCKVKADGKILATNEYNYWGFGWDTNNVSMMHSKDIDKVQNYIVFAAIVLNGQKEYPYGTDAQKAPTRRAAWGFKMDGTHVCYCGTTAQTREELQDYMLSQGCIQALMLDGGGSVQCESNNPNERVVSTDKPARTLSNLLCFWFEGENRIIDGGLSFGVLTPRPKTEYLMFHHAAGDATAQAVHNYHKSLGWPGIAYHYYVRKNGQIFYGRPEYAVGNHCSAGVPANNSNSIAICFEGNFEIDKMSPEQLEAGQWLTKNIMARYPGIKLTKHNSNSATLCPGKNYPLNEMRDAVIGKTYIVDIAAKQLKFPDQLQATERASQLMKLGCDVTIL